MSLKIVVDVNKDALIGGSLKDEKVMLTIASREGMISFHGTERDMREMLAELRARLNDVTEEIKSKKKNQVASETS